MGEILDGRLIGPPDRSDVGAVRRPGLTGRKACAVGCFEGIREVMEVLRLCNGDNPETPLLDPPPPVPKEIPETCVLCQHIGLSRPFHDVPQADEFRFGVSARDFGEHVTPRLHGLASVRDLPFAVAGHHNGIGLHLQEVIEFLEHLGACAHGGDVCLGPFPAERKAVTGPDHFGFLHD